MKENGHLLCKVSRQDFLTDGLLSQCKPELTGLQSHVLIRVLCALQHVLQEQSTSSASLIGQDVHHFQVITINLPQRCCACEGWVGQLAPPAAWREPCTRSSAPPSPRLRPAQTDSGVTSKEEKRLKHCNYTIAYLSGNCFTWWHKLILTFTGASWSIYCRPNTKCLFFSRHLLNSLPNYPLFFDKHQGCVII